MYKRHGHLWLGTKVANALDMVAKGRGDNGDPSGERNGRAKLTETKVREMRTAWATDRLSAYQVALRFGVPEGTASAVIFGRTWKRLARPVRSKLEQWPCPRCKRILAIEAYGTRVHSNGRIIRQPYCPDCRRTYHAEVERARRDRHREAGLCVECNLPPEPGRSKCAIHRARQQGFGRRHYEKLRSEG